MSVVDYQQQGYWSYMTESYSKDYEKYEGILMKDDNVNSPSHYNQSGIECIEAIKASLGDEFQAYCKGNILKYVWRYRYKNGLEDLKKAKWYLDAMIKDFPDDDK